MSELRDVAFPNGAKFPLNFRKKRDTSQTTDCENIRWLEQVCWGLIQIADKSSHSSKNRVGSRLLALGTLSQMVSGARLRTNEEKRCWVHLIHGRIGSVAPRKCASLQGSCRKTQSRARRCCALRPTMRYSPASLRRQPHKPKQGSYIARSDGATRSTRPDFSAINGHGSSGIPSPCTGL